MANPSKSTTTELSPYLLRDTAILGNSRVSRLLSNRSFYEEPTNPPSPPQEKTYSQEEFQALQAQVDSLSQDKEKLSGVIGNLRPFEKKYKTVAAVLGNTDPEKLQELVASEEKARSMQEDLDQRILLARQETSGEYQKQIDEMEMKLKKAQSQEASVAKEYQIFQSYNQNGGNPEEFASFALLASQNVGQSNDGKSEIRDDNKTLLIFKPSDPKEQERPATLNDFMTMIADGQIDKYEFRHSTGLKRCMKAYNQSSGAGIPGSSSGGKSEGWKDQTGDALWNSAFS